MGSGENSRGIGGGMRETWKEEGGTLGMAWSEHAWDKTYKETDQERIQTRSAGEDQKKSVVVILIWSQRIIRGSEMLKQRRLNIKLKDLTPYLAKQIS